MACTNDVVLYTKFEDNLNDECGNHTLSTIGTVSYVDGIYDRCVFIEELTSYISVDGFTDISSDFSVSLWFNLYDIYASSIYFCGFSEGTDYDRFSFRIKGALDGIGVYINDVLELFDIPTIGLNEFHHIVVAGNGNVYFDKILVGTHSRSIISSTSVDGVSIGANGDGTSEEFAGYIDEVYFINKIVTQEDVNNLYDNTYLTPPPPMELCPGEIVSKYEFEDNALDSCNNNYDGTWYGTEQYEAGVYGQAAKFDSSYIDTGITELESNFSFAFWFKMNDNSENHILISAGSGSDANAFAIRYFVNNDMLILDYGANHDIFQPEVDRFYHIAFTSTGDVYIDKVKVLTEVGSPETFSFDASLKIGARSDATIFYSGHIDEFYYIKKIVTQEDVDRLYDDAYPEIIGPPPSITDFVASDDLCNGVRADFTPSIVSPTPTYDIYIDGILWHSNIQPGDIFTASPGSTWDFHIIATNSEGSSESNHDIGSVGNCDIVDFTASNNRTDGVLCDWTYDVEPDDTWLRIIHDGNEDQISDVSPGYIYTDIEEGQTKEFFVRTYYADEGIYKDSNHDTGMLMGDTKFMLGTVEPDTFMLGSTEVDCIYLGSESIWCKGPAYPDPGACTLPNWDFSVMECCWNSVGGIITWNVDGTVTLDGDCGLYQDITVGKIVVPAGTRMRLIGKSTNVAGSPLIWGYNVDSPADDSTIPFVDTDYGVENPNGEFTVHHPDVPNPSGDLEIFFRVRQNESDENILNEYCVEYV